ncbi:MAG TPA: RraA family protein [Candidatus Nanopelagicaceae bacterium]|nr:RraA family protein [Candidatus Nanopelagicaceae bacterium]
MIQPPQLATAAIADACIRLGITPKTGPFDLKPVIPGVPVMGPALPVTHLGSVDVFLEVIDGADPGSVLVIDNGGRLDEACIGDLVALEAKLAKIAAIVVWGCHRDTAQLRDIGLPIFSLGARLQGPIRVPPPGTPMRVAVIDGVMVRPGDIVIADDDGVIFVPLADFEKVSETASTIMSTEQRQATEMVNGRNLREQIGFGAYLEHRAKNPGYSLRDHLKAKGGAIET